MSKNRPPRLIIQLVNGVVTAVYGDPSLTNVLVRIVDYDVEGTDPNDDRIQIDREGSPHWTSWEAVAPMPAYLDLDQLFKED